MQWHTSYGQSSALGKVQRVLRVPALAIVGDEIVISGVAGWGRAEAGGR